VELDDWVAHEELFQGTIPLFVTEASCQTSIDHCHEPWSRAIEIVARLILKVLGVGAEIIEVEHYLVEHLIREVGECRTTVDEADAPAFTTSNLVFTDRNSMDIKLIVSTCVLAHLQPSYVLSMEACIKSTYLHLPSVVSKAEGEHPLSSNSRGNHGIVNRFLASRTYFCVHTHPQNSIYFLVIEQISLFLDASKREGDSVVSK